MEKIFYENGNFLTNGIITAANDNNKMMVLGGGLWTLNGQYSLNGQYDEIRLRGGMLSADRIKADYDMIVNRDFLRYGPVQNGKGAAEWVGNNKDNLGQQLLEESGRTRPHIDARPGWVAKEEVVFTVVQVVLK